MSGLSDWRFDITNTAKEDLDSLDSATKYRVLDKLKWFVANFQNVAPLPLSGRWRGFFKLRVGDWRVVYETDHGTRRITVHAIDNRNKVYKRKRKR